MNKLWKHQQIQNQILLVLGQDELNEKKYNLSLFGINLKTVTTSLIENRKVIPLGNIAGLKLYTKGVLVVGTNEVKGEDSKIYKPFEEAGIGQGDSITKINDIEIESTKKLLECISKSKDKKINVTYLKNGKEIKNTITPVKTGKNTYKLGLWVRDSSAGIGTLTFYDKLTNSIVSLGHGIQDIDTEKIVEISSGEFVTSRVNSIQKGKKDIPGKPVQYGTTKEFLKFFRLQSIADLPKLDETENERFELAR